MAVGFLTALFASLPHLTVGCWWFFFLCENKAGQTVLYKGMFLTTARHQLCQGMKRCLSAGSCAMTLFNLQSIKLFELLRHCEAKNNKNSNDLVVKVSRVE